MHIKRVVSSVSNGSNTLLYFLNDRGLMIYRKENRVEYDNFVFKITDVELCKLAEAIGLNGAGNYKIDPTNQNIKDFLKRTKCI